MLNTKIHSEKLKLLTLDLNIEHCLPIYFFNDIKLSAVAVPRLGLTSYELTIIKMHSSYSGLLFVYI